MGKSSIEWTDETWNPVRGCTKISPGCKHCYAATFAERWRGIPGHAYEQGFDLRLVPHKLVEPLRWAKPRTVFVNSMSDLFQGGVPDSYVRRVWEVMEAADWHVFQLLTKRAERMLQLVPTFDRHMVDRQPPSNVWLGVSVENRKHGIPRINELRETPAAVRFLSIEPLLEDLGPLDLAGIDWVIVGGESGPGARPMHPDWPESIKAQCDAAGVAFFFKQWGEYSPVMNGDTYEGWRVGKKKAGRKLLGRTWDAMPPMSCAPYPGHRAARDRSVQLGLETGQTQRSLPVIGGSP